MSSSSPARFDATVYTHRLREAAALAAQAGLDALIVAPGPDLRYLIGSAADTFERLTALVITAAATPRLVVARLELAAVRESVSGLDIDLVDWVDGENPYALAVATLPPQARVAVSDSMPALHVIPIADLVGSTPALATSVLRQLRMSKDAAEIDALRRAGAAIDRVHARMGEMLRPRRTEAAVAEDIRAAIIEEGHSEAAFIIVGSGPHGADPHHEFSDRVIEPTDIVVIDIGGPVAPGYYSDCTRTYAFAEPDPAVAAQYQALFDAQAAAVAAVRPGATAESIDAAARNTLAEHGLAEHFIHRTGHGIGLSVHEEPYIVGGNTIELTPGMAFSVEPGIYFSGQWGARIEDIVVVTEDGCESMNGQPHELAILRP